MKNKLPVALILICSLYTNCEFEKNKKADIGFLSFLGRLSSNRNNSISNVPTTPTTILYSVIASTTATLTTSESAASANFTLKLSGEPKATVNITLSSSDLSEGIVTPNIISFSSSDWNIAKTITVTGQMDSIVDGNINYQIITSNTVSADPNFNGLIVPDLNVVNLDEGITNPTTPTSPITYSVITSPISGLSTSESGTTSNLTLKLSAQPGANVTINLFSSNPLEGAVSPNTVTFTTTDWNTPKMFTVTGLDDQVADGHINYQIITSNTISSDSNFNGLIVPDFNVTNLDVGEKITFVTSMEYDGSLGGIAGADAKCNEASNKPTILPNVYKALLVHSTQRRATTVSGGSGSSSVGQFDWVFKPNTAYFQMNKTTKIVQTNVNGLYNLNSIDNQFDLNGGVYWTGLLNTWLVGVNCTDWTVTTGNGDIGFGNATNNTALAGASPQLCNTAANRRLLCIQQ